MVTARQCTAGCFTTTPSVKQLGARTLLGAPGLTRNKKLLGAPGITTRSKKLLGNPWSHCDMGWRRKIERQLEEQFLNARGRVGR